MSNNHLDRIEKLGRSALPSLPTDLRARTLTRCAQVINQKHRQQRRRGWFLVGTLAGVCAIHWIAISTLNAETAMLIPGNNSNQTAARFAMTPQEFQNFQQQRAALFANYDGLSPLRNKGDE